MISNFHAIIFEHRQIFQEATAPHVKKKRYSLVVWGPCGFRSFDFHPNIKIENENQYSVRLPFILNEKRKIKIEINNFDF